MSIILSSLLSILSSPFSWMGLMLTKLSQTEATKVSSAMHSSSFVLLQLTVDARQSSGWLSIPGHALWPQMVQILQMEKTDIAGGKGSDKKSEYKDKRSNPQPRAPWAVTTVWLFSFPSLNCPRTVLGPNPRRNNAIWPLRVWGKLSLALDA